MSILDGATVRPSGEAAVVLEYGDTIDVEVHERVLAADRAVTAATIPGLEEAVPSYRSLLLRLDPRVTTPDELVAALRGLTPAGGARAPRRVEVLIDPGAGEDLEVVAEHAGTDAAGVVALLTGIDLRVYLHGFAPGFAYLGGVPSQLHVPRRPTPRSPVPPGSVLLAAGQAALCPTPMPTGWWVVARTDAALFDPTREPPVPFEAGDRVRLVAQ